VSPLGPWIPWPPVSPFGPWGPVLVGIVTELPSVIVSVWPDTERVCLVAQIVTDCPSSSISTFVPLQPKIDKVSLLPLALIVFLPLVILLNISWEEPLSVLVIVIVPPLDVEVISDCIPLPCAIVNVSPFVTDVLSVPFPSLIVQEDIVPCGLLNDVVKVPPSCCVSVNVIVLDPESLKPVIILS